MKTRRFFWSAIFCILIMTINAKSIFIEAESFKDKGGWVVDPQFVEQMGSPYLLAHGMGRPVKDAVTTFHVEKSGTYHVWVRTKNWVPGEWKAPGRFKVGVNSRLLANELGLNNKWGWECAGKVSLVIGQNTLSLHDLTGFEGRCDAIYFTSDRDEKLPEGKLLKEWRIQQTRKNLGKIQTLHYDFVVVGGGIAGTAAAMTAAEHGLKVALIHDRSVLGGNASGEVRVHTLGIYGSFERILRKIDTEHYPNGSVKAINEDIRRMKNVTSYKNIDLYLNMRAFNTIMQKDKISSVEAEHIETGERTRFDAPLFVDCTGDGWIGYWAGADYSYGREAVSVYNEEYEGKGDLWSPVKPDNRVMGASVLWNTENAGKPVTFPEVPWALPVTKGLVAHDGEWYWEFSSNDLNQIDDGEQIRDHMFRAIYGSFYNFKTKKAQPSNKRKNPKELAVDSLQLKWVSFLLGKRESRRLIGDYVYTFNDVRNLNNFEDAVVFEKRAVDIHYQLDQLDDKYPDFLSEAIFFKTAQYSIPYRTLYSRNISNLFMAGRNFSCSHAGLGGPRVMLTTGQMGAAVGIAASVCKKYRCTPREVYTKYLKEYLSLIEQQK